MVRNATELAQRIHKVDKEAKLEGIIRLMKDYNISIGELVEYANSHLSTFVSTAERLREINQIRKKGRELKAAQQLNIAKARQTRKDKREQLVANAHAAQAKNQQVVDSLTVEAPKLNFDDIDLDALDFETDEQ